MSLCSLQSTFTMEGDKLVQVQKWDGKESRFVREIKDGKMVMVRARADLTLSLWGRAKYISTWFCTKRIFNCLLLETWLARAACQPVYNAALAVYHVSKMD